eukprot:scaffold1590_cov417-Prasinococcus_capsulatus_cf.AAC.15
MPAPERGPRRSASTSSWHGRDEGPQIPIALRPRHLTPPKQDDAFPVYRAQGRPCSLQSRSGQEPELASYVGASHTPQRALERRPRCHSRCSARASRRAAHASRCAAGCRPAARASIRAARGAYP